MSLVSTYVQSQEGNWYKNPVIKSDGWFICWDDDEPIELVIDKDSGFSLSSILAGLAKRGWKLVLIGRGSTSERMFGRKFIPAYSYFLKQVALGPTDKLLEGNKYEAERPQGQGVFYMNSANGNGGFDG